MSISYAEKIFLEQKRDQTVHAEEDARDSPEM
jgi:hypothetical protein